MTIIIGEAGVNHNGDIQTAKELINVAKESGCDYVKFQTFSASRQAKKDTKKAQYQINATGNTESHYEMLARLELTKSMHIDLINHCKKVDIKFLSTAFDIESVELLHELGVKLYKIPSGEITNFPYLKKIAELNEKVILSTGMSTISDIDKALKVLVGFGTRKDNISILHCTSAYPVEMEDINLNAMKNIGKEFDIDYGYSDHSNGIEIPIAAVALGAKIIEKHFTLDRSMEGPDHAASLEPHELNNMVNAIRNIEKSLGDGKKRVMPSEQKNIDIARKSIVASKNIKKGEVFTNENITTKRPGNGISPMRWEEIIGTKSKHNFIKDDLITS